MFFNDSLLNLILRQSYKKFMENSIVKIQEDINNELANPEVINALLTTTFKGLDQNVLKRAIMEGMMRGFTFKDFLEKNVYAIPFLNAYSLVTSIDYARKVGMRSGVVGKSAPIFEEKDGKVVSCTVTVKRSINGYIGDYTATVFFDEYYKAGKNGKRSLWDDKPRTMISKVAEMHALRMACPEELAQSYVEEEFDREKTKTVVVDVDVFRKKLTETKTLDELKAVWSALPVEAKNELEDVKEELKSKYEDAKV